MYSLKVSERKDLKMSDSIPDALTVGKRIKKYRESLGITQEELAKAIGTSASAISMYETGSRFPRDEYKKKMAILFGVSIDSIFFNQ